MGKTLINGVAYSWSGINMNILGTDIKGFTEINYSEKQDKVNNYGAGVEPVSRGYGRKEYSASITLEMKEVRRIQSAMPPGKSLLDIPAFPIAVSYLNGNKVITDIIHKAEFTNNVVETKQGDSNIPVKLDLIIAGITWGK